MRSLSLALLILLAGCSAPQQPSKTAESKVPAAGPPKITQFYAVPPQIGKGEKAKLCYSVTDAEKLALEPPVEKVWPALSRCFEVGPAATTKYTLTADDGKGHSDVQTATVEVGPARPASARGGGGGAGAGRYIIEVTVSKLAIRNGEPVVICYKARNATSVRITPGIPAHASPDRGCITDRPKKTTNYEVIATGPDGQKDTERVTVTVR